METLYLNVSAVLAEYPGHDMNNLRDILEAAGATTDGLVVDGETFMVIDGLTRQEVINAMSEHGVDEFEDEEFLTDIEPEE